MTERRRTYMRPRKAPQIFMPAPSPVPSTPQPAGQGNVQDQMFMNPLVRQKASATWRDRLPGTLMGIGAGLLTGKNLSEGLGQGIILANQFEDQRLDRQAHADAADFQRARFDYEIGKDQRATADQQKAIADRNAAIDALDVPENVKMWIRAGGDYDPFPKAEGPQSSLAKLKADLDAGLIDPATYNAAVRKENYIAPQQGPSDPERVRVAKEAGLVPGTPAYQQFLLGKDDTPAGPFQGTGLDAQSYNIVLTGDPSKPEYAAAYAQLAQPKVTLDPVTQKYVIVSPDMSWARKPTGGASPAPASPLPSQAQPTIQVPGATITADQGRPVYTDSQGKAAGFSDRMSSANAVFDDPKVAAAGQDWVEGVKSSVPLVGNFLTSEDRQKFEQAERNFINAQLRRESGAVISPEEFANARAQYIPQPGDSEAVLKQKKVNRQQVIDAMAREGGPFYKPTTPTNDPLGIRK